MTPDELETLTADSVGDVSVPLAQTLDWLCGKLQTLSYSYGGTTFGSYSNCCVSTDGKLRLTEQQTIHGSDWVTLIKRDVELPLADLSAAADLRADDDGDIQLILHTFDGQHRIKVSVVAQHPNKTDASQSSVATIAINISKASGAGLARRIARAFVHAVLLSGGRAEPF